MRAIIRGYRLGYHPSTNGEKLRRSKLALAGCRREKKPPELLAWIAKSRLKQGKNSLEIARFGNLAKPKGNFSGFSDSLLDGENLHMSGHRPCLKRLPVNRLTILLVRLKLTELQGKNCNQRW